MQKVLNFPTLRDSIRWTNYYFAVNDNGAKVKDKSKAVYHRASWSMGFVKTYDATYRGGSYFGSRRSYSSRR